MLHATAAAAIHLIGSCVAFSVCKAGEESEVTGSLFLERRLTAFGQEALMSQSSSFLHEKLREAKSEKQYYQEEVVLSE